MKILVLGASGMLGNAMLRILAEGDAHDVYGTARSAGVRRHFAAQLAGRIVSGVDVENADALARLFDEVRPQVVINCIGLVKQLAAAADPLQALPINALLPHRLARLCALVGARLVHVSTDCVFDGRKGNYRETDPSDAEDLYGKSKYLGEVAYPHTITLRTSIIGRELDGAHALVGWFLAQDGKVRGYRKAVFSGLPTIELSSVVRDVVLPRPDLSGLYHVAAAPIAKYELLKLVAAVYGKAIEIEPDDSVVIDRSLDTTRFREATGYVAPPWPELVARMRDFN
ncbi:MAG: dTDP-4-dehydrorhamnose reductase [bacterium]|nr:MAG: dTDP-4-dehydrorhamnose reductase [bacterium]KAF0147156.1 MAG: dTDP-4-dehydrorhamnose reductase [bacterium]KAF0165721.1 MAG: dTDP-4-dehydrorhamnose reductase [bacterium]